MPVNAPLESLLRACDGPAAMEPLLGALGLTGALPADVGYDPIGPRDPELRCRLRGDVRGLRWVVCELPGPVTPALVARLARGLASRDPVHPHLLVLADPGWRRLTFAAAVGGAVRTLAVDRRRPRREEVNALIELAASQGEGGTALALRHARALGRSGITRRFFRDFRARRDAIAAGWQSLPSELEDQREALALLFLSRLMFLYFLQAEGHLSGDSAYLPRLVRRPGLSETIYRQRLEPLFFGALNRRPEQRDAAARALGDLPYLNGGLFERHAVERRAPLLDLPDEAVLCTFDRLMDRYRFTPAESAADPGDDGRDDDVAIDPEMLGRVFEGLMEAGRRGDTGSFYTPSRAVEKLTRECVAAYLSGHGALSVGEAKALVHARPLSLDADRAACALKVLKDARVLDPACGSGAFLLGALRTLSRARLSLGGGDAREIRRDTVATALHGVDVQADAALLCELRLWLALAQRPAGADVNAATPPLPNLDVRIRQGDALLDPMDLLLGHALGRGERVPRRDVRLAVGRIAPLAQHFLSAEPEEKEGLRAALREAERALADAWLGDAACAVRHQVRELEAAARGVDLFGDRTLEAVDAGRKLIEALRLLREAESLRERVRDGGELPFFSFAVHFAEIAERGFGLVLSNPPWLRARRWPAALRRIVRERYEVCRSAGWHRGAALAGAPAAAGAQVDLALLFLERSLHLLAPGGVLGMVLPAKMMRSLYGAGGRRLLLRDAELVGIEDHSLDQHSLFRADAFAATVVARRRPPEAATMPPSVAPVRITLVQRRMPPLSFSLEPGELPLVPGDLESPWLLVPPGVRLALRRMQACPALGDDPALRVRRGAFTGANDCLLMDAIDPKLGGLARIRAHGARATGPAAIRDEDRRAPPRQRHARARADEFEAVIEQRALAPALRGSGIAEWRYEIEQHVLWVHDDETAQARSAPRLAARYLELHAAAVDKRDGTRRGAPPGALLRVTPDTLRPKVAWKDLALTLEAVALPARVDGPAGRDRPLVPLNTIYFIPVSSAAEAFLLSAYFNSLPVRTFARSVAERAKDARFRFFAWVIGLLPLPAEWRSGPSARRLLAIGKDAHSAGGIADARQEELDGIVARSYRLKDEQLNSLCDFDRWLRGQA